MHLSKTCDLYVTGKWSFSVQLTLTRRRGFCRRSTICCPSCDPLWQRRASSSSYVSMSWNLCPCPCPCLCLCPGVCPAPSPSPSPRLCLDACLCPSPGPVSCLCRDACPCFCLSLALLPSYVYGTRRVTALCARRERNV